VYVVEMKAVV